MIVCWRRNGLFPGTGWLTAGILDQADDVVGNHLDLAEHRNKVPDSMAGVSESTGTGNWPSADATKARTKTSNEGGGD